MTRLFVPLILVLCSPANAEIEISNLRHTPHNAHAFEKIEVTFELNEAFSNPYDPDEADIWLDFRDPSGVERSIPAFWFEGYIWNDGRLRPDGRRTWMARTVGEIPGRHQYRVRVNKTTGPVTSDWQSVTCSRAARPGFIRVDQRNPRYLAFSNGTPYRSLGPQPLLVLVGKNEGGARVASATGCPGR